MGKDHLNKKIEVASAREVEHGEIASVQAKPGGTDHASCRAYGRSRLTGHHFVDNVVSMASSLTRLSVALDHRLLAEALRLTRSRSKRATIAKALEELVKLERRKALVSSLGTGIFQTTEAEFHSRRRRAHARR